MIAPGTHRFAAVRTDSRGGTTTAPFAAVAWIASLLAIALAACKTSSPKPEAGVVPGKAAPDHHPVLSPSAIVDLGAGRPGIAALEHDADPDATPTPPAGLPPITRVPVGATIFFRNADPDHFVQLTVSGDFETCAGCVTVTNFTCMKAGARAAAIEPGGVSTLCFHTPGRYPFRVVGGALPLIGYLEVTSPAPGSKAGG